MMEILIYLLLAALLLLLNAFFVLAEFACVKVRPSRIEELAEQGNTRAKTMRHIQSHLDQYLSVCQVGITFASIGLGFVGEPSFARLFKPLFAWLGAGGDAAAHGLAVSAAYVLVSFLHIVIGELVPKSYAIRKTEESALWTALPMRFFHTLFFLPLWVLNGAVNLVLPLLRVSRKAEESIHSEGELRIILNDSQSSGTMSFRRLLYIENVLDLGALTVRDAMRPRSTVRCLRTAAAPGENEKVIAEARYSRYPLLGDDPEKPLGIIHVKSLYLAQHAGKLPDSLAALARPCLTVKETMALEQLLPEMQRKAIHVALVTDAAGKWTGFITLEDALEEVVGSIEEEFPLEEAVYLSDSLSPARVVLDVEGTSILDATRRALGRVPPADLPHPLEAVLAAVAEREKLVSSYVGKRLALPHARLAGLAKTVVVVARLKTPIPAPVPGETIDMLFILLTPAGMPRIHQVLLSRIAGIFDSDLLEERIREAATPAVLYETIRTAEQIILA